VLECAGVPSEDATIDIAKASAKRRLTAPHAIARPCSASALPSERERNHGLYDNRRPYEAVSIGARDLFASICRGIALVSIKLLPVH
jgi:hypothetical protein